MTSRFQYLTCISARSARVLMKSGPPLLKKSLWWYCKCNPSAPILACITARISSVGSFFWSPVHFFGLLYLSLPLFLILGNRVPIPHEKSPGKMSRNPTQMKSPREEHSRNHVTSGSFLKNGSIIPAPMNNRLGKLGSLSRWFCSRSLTGPVYTATIVCVPFL